MAFNLKDWVYGLKLSLCGQSLPFAVDFALFNGVKLPRLPWWNLATHPYAYISKYPNSDTYTLVALSVPMHLDGDVITTGIVEGSFSSLEWTTTGDSWTGGDERIIASHTYSVTAHVWSNVDISAAYPGSTPVPIYGETRPTPTPVAYLYNGVRLPKLPIKSKEYSCTSIIDITTIFDTGTVYRLFLSAGYKIVEFDGYCGIGLLSADNGILSYDCSVSTAGVILGGGWRNEQNGYVDGYALSNTIRNDVIWTDTDITLPNGTVYLAATEPVPVYE